MISHLNRRGALGGILTPLLLSSPSAVLAETAAAVSVRKFGARGDGITDDTDALTAAHLSGDPIYYPRTEAFYWISHVLPVRASTSSNGAEIRIPGDGSGSTAIFRVSGNEKPITISGFVLDGGYKGGTKGEWSHGIDINGGTKVTIVGNTISNPYGDCVYVGSLNNSVASSGIRIRGNRFVNPRRCNVAVVCGENVVIDENRCTKEVDYVFSIDLEPNLNRFDYVRDIHIANNEFDVKKFVSAGVSNGIENRRLSIIGNKGRALQFFHGWDNALLRDITIARNRFSASMPDGFMLNLEGVKGGIVADNVDETPCETGYRSIKIRDCNINLARNKFCT